MKLIKAIETFGKGVMEVQLVIYDFQAGNMYILKLPPEAYEAPCLP